MPQKKHYLFISLFLYLMACNEDMQTTFSEVNITTSNNKIVEINIPKANGNELVINNINEEINKTVSEALHVGNPETITSKSVEESITSFNNEYESFKNDFPETELPWEAQIDGEVIFQSSSIITIALTSYVNTGGAHGLLNVSFLNFDSITGEKIPNRNLIKNTSAFKKLAKTHLDKAIAEKDDAIFKMETFELPTNMGYSENGLVLLYNTYEIAPYSTGIIEFTIPFEDVEPFLVF